MSAAFGSVPVQVELERKRRYWILRVEHCPSCGRSHAHGGGLADRAPTFGPRAMPCRNRATYDLVRAP